MKKGVSESYMPIYGKHLKDLREERNISQQQLATFCNVKKQYISKIENSEYANVNMSIFHNIISFFDCTMDYLVGNTNKAGDFIKEHGVFTKPIYQTYSDRIAYKIQGQDQAKRILIEHILELIIRSNIHEVESLKVIQKLLFNNQSFYNTNNKLQDVVLHNEDFDFALLDKMLDLYKDNKQDKIKIIESIMDSWK